LDYEKIRKLVEKHRLVLPYRETIHDGLTVEGHYRAAHRGGDLDLLIKIAKNENPEFANSLKKTLAAKSSYYCSVFIAEKKLFDEFCNIIFPIFQEMLHHLDLESEDLQPGKGNSRVFGFMGERLLTAFVDYSCAKDPKLKPLHVARTVLNFKKPDFTTSDLIHKRENNPKVSVILPCYNVSEYLPHTFECLRAQTEKSIEIIAIDDGSTDNTREIIEYYSQRDKRIISQYQNNCGLGETRNAGFKIARGEYIHFFDPDDYILPTFYETMLRCGFNNRADVVMSCHWVVDPHSPAWDSSYVRESHLPASLRFGPNPTNAEENPSVFLAHTPVWDKLFRTDFLKTNKIYSIKLNAEDIPFTWMTYSMAKKISICSKNEYFYRNRTGSITGNYRIYKEVFESIKITEIWLKEKKLYNKYKCYWALKKFVSCAYGMYKIPNYLFSNPIHCMEYCNNLATLVNDIGIEDLDQFKNHALYKDWVKCFYRLKSGYTFLNIIEEISKCTQLPKPDISNIIKVENLNNKSSSYKLKIDVIKLRHAESLKKIYKMIK
jgi:glycosyltransferase involved in cell wall biosynthesis